MVIADAAGCVDDLGELADAGAGAQKRSRSLERIMTRIQMGEVASLLSKLMKGIGGSKTWWTVGQLAAVVLAAGVLAACGQEGAAPPAATLEMGAAVAASVPTAEAGKNGAGMKQFADGESNFAFSIPAEWNVFGPDHNAIGSQFIMGSAGVSWTSGEPAAVQVSVIDTATMTVDEALGMLCPGCQGEPEPITLADGLPALRFAPGAAGDGAVPVEFTIVEFGPKVVIFAVDAARAGMDTDTLLATLGPLDAAKEPGAHTGRTVYENISFMLPESVARWAGGESVEAVEGGSDTPWWEPAPQHAAITLVGYPVEGSVWTPRIVVYPVQELAAANPEAASRVELLRQLLETQAMEPGGQLPFLPLANAGGPLQAGVEFLNFQGGRGVRYLAQHGQGPAPINNQELFYTFQGLTDDGTHYIAVILPVTHASLPAGAENLPESEWQAWVENFAQYITDETEALEAQPDESFTPSLADLDAMMQSTRVMP
jgi:hypothetical protein